MPALSTTAASKRILIRSPRDATASIARGLASPSTAMALHKSTSERMSALISAFVCSRSFASAIKASAAAKCFSLSEDSAAGSESTFPCEAEAAESNSRFVTPDMADVTTTTLPQSFFASRMISVALFNASADPTDVPPNFMTSVFDIFSP